MIEDNKFISIENLSKTFHTNMGDVQAVSDVSFNLQKGSIVGLVGESGSGKTTLGRCILRLIEPSSGSVNLEGNNLLELSNKKLREIRKRMQIIFQDPFSSLNPRMRIKDIIAEGIKVHDKLSSENERFNRVAELMEEVGLQLTRCHVILMNFLEVNARELELQEHWQLIQNLLLQMRVYQHLMYRFRHKYLI